MLLFRRKRARQKKLPKSVILSRATEKILTEKMYLNPALKCDDVAKAIGTNRTYLWDSLRLKGYGFQEYLSKFRLRHFIEKAPEYRDLSCAEIAELCGFGDTKQLNRYLKQLFGITLFEYMKWISRGL